ncbi:MAG: peptidylprolyl isomerase [Pararhodobacter sp.]
MKKHLGFLAAGLCAVTLALPIAAQQAGDEPVSIDTVVARVGSAEITLGHAIALREQLPPQFRSVADETLFPAIIEQLIEQELLSQYKADDLSLRDRISLENEQRNYIANAALYEVANAAVTEGALSDAYAAFVAEFGEGDPATEYSAAHILVRTEDEIATVIAELETGRDFAEVAREFSLDGSAAEGGALGWFGPGVMIEPFEQAVMALEPGQVSGAVETRFGWHVVLLVDTRIASVPPLDAVRADLETQIQREATRALVTRLRADARIENFAESIAPETLSRSDLLDE